VSYGFQLGSKGVHKRVKLLPQDQNFGLSIAKYETDLLFTQSEVDGYGNGTDFRRSKTEFQILVTIPLNDSHSASFADPPFQQGVGQPIGALIQIAEGKPLVPVNDRFPIGEVSNISSQKMFKLHATPPFAGRTGQTEGPGYATE
jgi:hypothetical protein